MRSQMIWLLVACYKERFASIASCDDTIISLLQVAANDTDQAGFIIDDKNKLAH